MPSVTAFQTNFSAGELSPRLYGRVDVAKYMNGCHTLENMIVQRFGGARKRGGTQFINSTRNNNLSRLIPFVFSVTQSYILEFTSGKIRIYTSGGIVESGGSPIEVNTPYSEGDLFDIQFAQSADVLYLVHPNHAPRKFSRTSVTTFTLEEVEFEDGPYLEINATGTSLTPSARGSVVPTMTSNTTPSGTAASGDSSPNAYRVFDGSDSTFYSKSGSTFGDVSYTPTSSVTADAYYVVSISREGNMLSTWTFEGYNGSSWIVLDTRQGETGWLRGERRFFTFNNDTAYQAYRINWSGTDGGTDSNLAELGIHQKAAEQTPFNLTASSTAGINDGAGFLATDVGRNIRLMGSDGQWRWAKITSRTSSTVVKVRLYGQALPDTSPITNWRMGAWSDQTGWPAAVGFYNSRLCFARTENQPQTVWMSVVDDQNNLGVSTPGQDDDAITVTIASESLNEINWLAEGTDLFVGTSAAIRTIGPTSGSAAFSPTNLRQRRETNYGASNVQPVRVGTTALYSGYYRKDIREIAYSFDFNGYVSQNRSILSEHITGEGIKQMAYAQDPDSVVWFTRDSNLLAGMTYERDQEVVAFHRQTIAGTYNSPSAGLISARVDSVATIPGTGGDETWMVVRRTINGSTTRYIERLTSGLSDNDEKESATFLDSHLNYSGSSTTTLSGLSHLEGEEVYVWGTGGKQGPYTVSSGGITLGSAVTKACVGLAYTSAIETLSPEAAARGGTAQTRLGRISEVFLRLNRSMNGKCGSSDGDLISLNYPDSFDEAGNRGDPDEMYTGDVRVPITMEWNRQKRIRVEHSEPTPFHLLGLITEIRVSG